MRRRNDGLRKLCDCPRKRWSECPHSWYFNFKWKDKHYRFSLDKELGRRIDSKSVAEIEAENLRRAIREGRFRSDLPVRETLTFAAMMDAYRKRHIAIHRPTTLKTTDYVIAKIMGTVLERPDGQRRHFGAWLVADITTETIEQYRQAQLPSGTTGTNRHLELLRSLFNWATSSKRKLAAENPFVDGTKAAVKMAKEAARRRRLCAGEGERLLVACSPHLRTVVECALETGMRRGEILSLQWWQVRFAPRAEIFLPAVKTKTKTDRTVPISSRLKAVLEMRRNGPDGKELPADAYVFGNECGERVGSIKRAWQATVLRAHGHTPAYTPTANLTSELGAALRAIDLNFHDLRREAGSRWLDARVPLHRIQKWLGHTNISQTSTYLMADAADDEQAMRDFEAQREALQKLATNSETPRRRRPRTATMRDNNPRLSSERSH